MEFDKKYALVTGASRGIGKAIARALCDNGAFVYMVAKDPNTLATAAYEIDPSSNKVKAMPCDIASNTNIKELFARLKADEVDIDILVNAAGVAPTSSAEDMSSNDWNEALNINLNAAFNLSKAAFVGMKRNLGGKIINISSILGTVASPGLSAYCSSKGGLIMLTKELACEWARFNIQVNAVLPGYIYTDMTQGLRSDPILNQKIINRTPAARWGKPEDIANAVLFLASNSSDYITGAILNVDGGMSASLM